MYFGKHQLDIEQEVLSQLIARAKTLQKDAAFMGRIFPDLGLDLEDFETGLSDLITELTYVLEDVI